MIPRFGSSLEIETLVQRFQDASIPNADWTHASHIAVAVRHALWYPEPEATNRMREGIQQLNQRNCVAQTPTGGYHETLTRFYMWAVRRHLRGFDIDLPLVDTVNNVVEALWDRSIPLQYYSRERLMSWEARTSWVEPDLRPME